MPRINSPHINFLYKFILPSTILFVLGASLNVASAYVWGTDYGVETGVGVHDNYRLTDDNQEDTASAEVGGFASLEGSTEISRIGLDVRAGYRTFTESSIDDEESYNIALSTSRTGERLNSYVTLSYDYAPTTETELEDTGRNEDGARKTASVTPGAAYQLDERNAVAADLSYRDVSYDTVSLTEYTNTSVSLSWIYQIDEARSFTTSYVYTLYDPDNPEDPDDDGETDINTVNLGYDQALTEATSYNLTLGAAHVDAPNDTSTNGVGSFSVVHQPDELNTFSLILSRSYEGSGDGDVREEDRVSGLWSYSMTERSRVTASATSVATDDRNYYTISAGYNYNYTREVVLSASYRYRRRNEDGPDIDTAHSNSLLFTLLYSPL